MGGGTVSNKGPTDKKRVKSCWIATRAKDASSRRANHR